MSENSWRKWLFLSLAFTFVSLILSFFYNSPPKSFVFPALATLGLVATTFLGFKFASIDASPPSSFPPKLELRLRELTQERNRLKTLLEGMKEGVLLTDAQGRILLVNPSLYRILPITGRCEGKTLLECLRHKDIHDLLAKVLKEGVPREEEVCIQSGSQETYLLSYMSPLREPEGEGGAIAVFIDVTEIRKLEQARTEFVANVSHELKTPLTSIRGYAETLRMGALNDRDVASRFVQKIEDNATQLQNLIEDLLHLAEIESGREEIRPEMISLREAVGAVQSNFEESIENKKQSFRGELPDFWVKAEPSALKQILSNLIDNAHKYTPEGGTITVAAEKLGDFCKIQISDTGMGIPVQDLPHVFERFYRVDKARSREIGGTGLGLAIVKHLVQTHGGEVGVSSNPGTGSQFFFTLPLALPHD